MTKDIPEELEEVEETEKTEEIKKVEYKNKSLFLSSISWAAKMGIGSNIDFYEVTSFIEINEELEEYYGSHSYEIEKIKDEM